MLDALTYLCSWPRRAAGLLLVATCLLLTWPVPETQAQRVQAFIEQDSVAIGERFELSVVADYNFMMQALLPAYDDTQADNDSVLTRLGDVEIIAEKRRAGGYYGSDRPGVRADTIIFEATTFALDTAYVPSISVSFTAGTDTVTASSRAFTIRVASHLPHDASDIHDLAPLAPFPRAWWPWMLLGVLGLLLASAVVWLVRRRQKQIPPPVEEPEPAPAPSPYEIASSRLQHLVEDAALDVPDGVKPFYVELVDIMRTYLEGRLHIPAREMTTLEVLREILRRSVRGPFPKDTYERMRTLLTEADLVKFADETSDPESARSAADETQALLDQMEASLPSTTQDTSEGEGVRR